MTILLYISTVFALDLVVEANKVFRPSVTDLSIDTKDHKVYFGTTFNLSCTVNFNPSVNSIPQIAFVRHGYRVTDIPGKYENFPMAVVNGALRNTAKLSLKNVTIEEKGNWSCYGIQLEIKGNSKEIYLEIVPCPAGYYCPWNESTKHECPYRTYSDGLTNITYQCIKCPGQYPSTTPKGYSGPAKSIQGCPAKGTGLEFKSFNIALVICLIVSIILSCDGSLAMD